MEKELENRYQSAKELSADLRQVRHAMASTRDAPVRLPGGKAGEPVPSIAVLPFVNMSPDPENEYFSAGLAEELINALTKVERLRVAARSATAARTRVRSCSWTAP